MCVFNLLVIYKKLSTNVYKPRKYTYFNINRQEN